MAEALGLTMEELQAARSHSVSLYVGASQGVLSVDTSALTPTPECGFVTDHEVEHWDKQYLDS